MLGYMFYMHLRDKLPRSSWGSIAVCTPPSHLACALLLLRGQQPVHALLLDLAGGRHAGGSCHSHRIIPAVCCLRGRPGEITCIDVSLAHLVLSMRGS